MIIVIIYFIAYRIIQKPETASFWIGGIYVPGLLATVAAFCALLFSLIIARYVRFHQIMQLVIQHTTPPPPQPEKGDDLEVRTQSSIDERNLLYASGYLNQMIGNITQLETTTKAVDDLLRSEFFSAASSHLSDINQVLDQHRQAGITLLEDIKNARKQPNQNAMNAVANEIWSFRGYAQRAITESMIALRGAKSTPKELWPFPSMFSPNDATTRSEAKLASFNRYYDENYDGRIKLNEMIKRTWNHVENTPSRTTNTTPPTETDPP